MASIVSSTLAWGGIGGVRGLNEQCTLKWIGEHRVDECQNGIRCVNPPGINFFRVGICKARRGSACNVDTDCDSTRLACHTGKCMRRRTTPPNATVELAPGTNVDQVVENRDPKSNDEIMDFPPKIEGNDSPIPNDVSTENDFPNAQIDTPTQVFDSPTGNIGNDVDGFESPLGSELPDISKLNENDAGMDTFAALE